MVIHMDSQGKFGGISEFTLRMLAMAFMLCDHIWATLVPGNRWLTLIGRLAFPIFAFMLAEGFCHTGNRKKYALRLLVFAVVSEIPFNLMYIGSAFFPFYQNVMWTLLIGFGCISLIEKIRAKGKTWLTVTGVLAVSALGWLAGTVLLVDYHGEGVLTVILFYVFRGRKWWQMAGQLLGMCLINFVMIRGMTIPLDVLGRSFELPQQGLAVLALAFIWMYRGRQGYHNRAVQIACYAFYPCHMAALVLLAGV